jgi:hypothetical protein
LGIIHEIYSEPYPKLFDEIKTYAKTFGFKTGFYEDTSSVGCGCPKCLTEQDRKRYKQKYRQFLEVRAGDYYDLSMRLSYCPQSHHMSLSWHTNAREAGWNIEGDNDIFLNVDRLNEFLDMIENMDKVIAKLKSLDSLVTDKPDKLTKGPLQSKSARSQKSNSKKSSRRS